jgi:hypothetical protein
MLSESGRSGPGRTQPCPHRDFPELTIAEIRSGLPDTATLLDRVADGLENRGMRYVVTEERVGGAARESYQQSDFRYWPFADFRLIDNQVYSRS